MFKSTLYTTVLMAVSLTLAAPQSSQGASTGLAMWAQCGGIGYTGPTVCAAPGACEYQNDWYSQCKTPSTTVSATSASVTPVKSSSSRSTVTITSTSTAPVSKSSSTSSTAASSVASAVVLPVTSTSFLSGVNMAGYDFGINTDGSATGTPVTPPTSQFAHFAGQGVNTFRVPFGWQYMQPTLGGAIDSSFFSRYDATVKLALSQSTKPYVILDLHNYARWNGAVVGQGGPTNDQLANVWSQLATKYKDEHRIIFGIMNEPHDVNVNSWVTTVQAVVKAIRAAGATSQNILIPGSTWSHASALPTEAGPGLLGVKDADGSTSKLIFDVHQYLDSDGSGTHTECVTDNVNTFSTLATWLRQNGNRKAILSETGGGNTASCQKAFATQLAYLKQNSDVYMGYTVWSAGAFDTSYELSVTPNGNTDSALWSAAVKPLL